MPTFDDGVSNSGAHTAEGPVLIALGSPFINAFFTVIPPSTVLCRKACEDYSLFLNGFKDYSTVTAYVSSAEKHFSLLYKHFIGALLEFLYNPAARNGAYPAISQGSQGSFLRSRQEQLSFLH